MLLAKVYDNVTGSPNQKVSKSWDILKNKTEKASSQKKR